MLFPPHRQKWPRPPAAWRSFSKRRPTVWAFPPLQVQTVIFLEVAPKVGFDGKGYGDSRGHAVKAQVIAQKNSSESMISSRHSEPGSQRRLGFHTPVRGPRRPRKVPPGPSHLFRNGWGRSNSRNVSPGTRQPRPGRRSSCLVPVSLRKILIGRTPAASLDSITEAVPNLLSPSTNFRLGRNSFVASCKIFGSAMQGF